MTCWPNSPSTNDNAVQKKEIKKKKEKEKERTNEKTGT